MRVRECHPRVAGEFVFPGEIEAQEFVDDAGRKRRILVVARLEGTEVTPFPRALLSAPAPGGGNIANDISDAGIDAVNKPRRPIPSGRLSIRAARVWYAALSAILVALATILLPWPVAGLVKRSSAVNWTEVGV